MWIIPKPITSAFVPDTGALISDSEEQSHAFAQSLIQRSKVTRAPTWLRRLRQDSWIQLLSGRMLRASHTDSFTAAYTSSLGATLANHSQPLGSALGETTPATYGHGSQMELLSCDPACASSRTSKDTLPLGCVTLSTTWESWVTERRGEYLARLKLGRRTSASECSYWPTMQTTDSNSPCLTENRLNRPKGTQLREAIFHELRTPQAMTANALRGQGQDPIKRAAQGHQVNLQDQMVIYGRPDPVSNSTDGNRQELWRTPNSQLIEAKPDGIKLTNRTPKDPQVGLADQVKACAVQSWPTPSAMDGQRPSETPQQWETRNASKKASNPNLGQLHRPLTVAVQWATPRAEHDSGMHRGKPDTLHSQMESWPTPSASGDSNPGSNADPIKWQKIADAKKAQGIHKQLFLTTKVAMGHPGKLNPRWVETLMGVPVGWTMATCSHPLAIEPMNSGFSETASSQPQQP